jgi:hypothetical protein
MKLNHRKTTVTFWLLFIVGIFLILQFSVFNELLSGPIFLLPIAIFFILGGLLTYFTFKEKIKGKLKKFFLLTGISALGFFACIILHNFFYALAEISGGIIILPYLMEFLHAAFFLIGIIVCPLGYLVGLIGSFVLILKGGKK